MKTVYFASGKHIPRRTILKAAGAALALPWLDAMSPAFARQESKSLPRRMIAINVDLGFMSDRFFPKQPGRDYELSEYLNELAELRDDFTVFSGLHHPGTGGQHVADRCFLTAATHPARPGFKNTISLDQHMADEIGFQTRWPSLALRVGPGSESLSYTADGVRVPAIERPSEVYKALFVQGSSEQVRQQVQRLRNGQSLMDEFAGEISRLKRGVGNADRQRLDQYFSSLRELETRLEAQEAWTNTPKPRVDVPVPKDNTSPGGLVPKTRLLYDMARLALETDSTRVITILVNEAHNPTVDLPGVDSPHHGLTHQASQKGDELAIIERAQMKCLADLLTELRGVEEHGRTLLDSTMVLHGSNIGDAARHDGANLPMLLAGGGFKHGSHLTFDRKNNEPLANVFVSMLQRMDIEAEQFASSTGTARGLEFI
ncbi:DUF1552 domain-containing protein [Rubinisphaera margarita]|uniref:DUF1552 domain-containing protein n=1 Tax=Rubinisphaera margarita TaxID=2909586 RepID=UPI001EE98B0A|nr:DUF1552 domain-containing protein [Rubinisphaera margarita]MCG6156358.1 DUF1552 domain-containing protein [Rubinisphaera margarita]